MIGKRNGTAAMAVVILATCILLAGCGSTNTPLASKPTVKVMELKKSSLMVYTDYPSKIYPSVEVNVSSKIPGKVSQVYFDVGDEVKQGDILFTLESEDMKSQLKQSEAALSSTKESVKQQRLEAEKGLNQAKLQYDDAKSIYDKSQSLYESGAISKQERDNAETSYKNAKLMLDTAQNNLAIIDGTGSGGLASAQVDQAQSAVDTVAAQVDNSIIRSPIDGKVSVCNVKAGEMTSSGMLGFTVINSGSMTAEINVPGDLQAKLSKGQVLDVKVGVSQEASLQGTVDTIAPAADPKSGFYTVKISLDNKNGALTSGMFAKISVPFESREGIFTVPGGAVVSENGIEYLYLVSKGLVEKRIVKTGVSTEKAVEVEGGLKEGDMVILDGQSFLDEGEKVDSAGGGIQ